MKKNHLFGFIILIFSLINVFPSWGQTEVNLHFSSGSDQIFTVSEAGKLFFENGYLYIYDGTSVPYSFEVSSISKMTFNTLVNIEDIATDNLRVYPNPVSNYLKIHNALNAQSTYAIYAMDGRLLLSGRYSNDNPIDISYLSTGLYILKTEGQSIKISKL